MDATLPTRTSPAPALHVALREVLGAALPGRWAMSIRCGTAVALFDSRHWRPWLAQAALQLDTAEAARVRRRRIAADRELLTLAYALHRLLLASILQCGPAAVPLYRDARGCPRIHGDRLHTSLSHADGLVAIAVSGGGPVGVDIERCARVAQMPAIARCVCHRDEAEALAGLDPDAQGDRLLRLWVRKEAALKAAGVGLAVEMNTFVASDEGLVSVPGSEPVQVAMLDGGAACIAALAGRPNTPVLAQWLQPG